MDFLFLFFAVGLILGGFALMAYGLISVARDNYKPRYTRSTYLPPKR